MPKIKTLSRFLAPVALLALVACQTTQPGGPETAAPTQAPVAADQSAPQAPQSAQSEVEAVEPLLIFLADTKPQADWAEVQIDAQNTLFLQPEAFITRNDLESVEAGVAETGEGLLALTLNAAGAQRLAQVTKDNIGKRLALVVDGTLLSIPGFSEPVNEGRLVFMVGSRENAMTAAQIIAGEDATPTP